MSREEFLRRKRVSERKRRERMKNDPVLREILKERDRIKYLKKKQKKINLIREMSPQTKKNAKRCNRERRRARLRSQASKELEQKGSYRETSDRDSDNTIVPD